MRIHLTVHQDPCCAINERELFIAKLNARHAQAPNTENFINRLDVHMMEVSNELGGTMERQGDEYIHTNYN